MGAAYRLRPTDPSGAPGLPHRARHWVSDHGGPDVLTPVDLDAPAPGAGEIPVRTTAVGVNWVDTYIREGVSPRDLPFIPGNEGANVAAPVEELVTIPDGVPDHVAASMHLQGLAAHCFSPPPIARPAGTRC